MADRPDKPAPAAKVKTKSVKVAKTKTADGKSKPSSRGKVQFAALPWRQLDDGTAEILVISSRETRRWVIPKGWPIKGLAANMTAMREAYEEAGIEGYPSMATLGAYGYLKRLRSGRETFITVDVYALQVTVEHADWPEMHQREKRWVPIAEAAQLVDEPELKLIISAFQPR